MFSLPKIFKKSQILGHKVRLYIELIDSKRKTSIRASRFEFRALFDFAESFDFWQQKGEKVTESGRVHPKSRTHFKAYKCRNSNQLQLGVPMRSQAIYFQFCTRFLKKIGGHFPSFCHLTIFFVKIFWRRKNKNKLSKIAWERISNT